LYRLVRLTGWTVPQIEAADADLMDWFLGFEGAEARAQEDLMERAKNDSVRH
jgi:hypothetical protein